MIGRVSVCLVVAAVGGSLIAGCGSSSSKSSGATVSTPVSTAAAATGTTLPSAGSTAGGVTGMGVQQAAAACKQAVRAAVTLTPTTKAKVEGICARAGSGDVEGARKAAMEVCAEIINSSPLPAGPAKEQALAQCRKGVASAGK